MTAFTGATVDEKGQGTAVKRPTLAQLAAACESLAMAGANWIVEYGPLRRWALAGCRSPRRILAALRDANRASRA